MSDTALEYELVADALQTVLRDVGEDLEDVQHKLFNRTKKVTEEKLQEIIDKIYDIL